MTLTRAEENRVIVLGAGISGLACARELQERGYPVLVVEARSRVGGRLKGGELQLPGEQSRWVDLGGALIHGIDKNPVYSLAKEQGIPTHSVKDCLLMDANGWPVDAKEDERAATLFNESLDETFQQTQHERPGQASFGSVFSELSASRRNPTNTALLQWHQSNLEVSCGASLNQLGYAWNDDEPYGFAGDHQALETSWKSTIEGLAEGLDILYDSPIRQVTVVSPESPQNEHHSKTTRTATPKSAPPTPTPTRISRRLLGEDANARRSTRSNKGHSPLVFNIHNPSSFSYDDTTLKPTANKKRQRPPQKYIQVTLQNGTTLQADTVVCTLPLGVLKTPQKKAGHVRFQPPLPPQHQTAIARLGCGLLNKCALSFSHVFWQDSDFLGWCPSLGNDEDDSVAASSSRRPHLVLNVHKYTGQPILLFYFGGAFALEMQNWTDQQVVQDCLSVLQTIKGGTVPPKPLDYHVTRWGHDAHSKMAFTYLPPGVSTEELRVLSTPAVVDQDQRPVLQFAGEHTTPYHPSTIHGAFLSGIREAYRLDLALDPEANGGLQFNSQELYQKTFGVRRLRTNIPKRTAQLVETRTRRPYRVMKLRKRPKPNRKDWKVMTSTATKAAVVDVPLQPRRKSQRSVSRLRTRHDDNDDENSRHVEEEHEKLTKTTAESNMDLAALEKRTLLRSMETYGRNNYAYIRSQCLPVYSSKDHPASGSRPSISQLRSKCQEILKSEQKTLPRPNLQPWTAQHVVTVVPEVVESKASVAPFVPSKRTRQDELAPVTQGQRKSRRTIRRPTPLNL